MEQLPMDILLNEVFLNLSPKDILNMCMTAKKFEKLCDDERLWSSLLERDFLSDLSFFQKEKLTNKDLYKFLYGLQVVKKFIYQKAKIIIKNLHHLYSLQHLWLDNIKLTSIPKEIGLLQNLKTLSLNNNQLKSIPKEVGTLKNLKYLYLYNNKLTSLPKELGQLQNLEALWVNYNPLRSLPKEILDLQPRIGRIYF